MVMGLSTVSFIPSELFVLGFLLIIGRRSSLAGFLVPLRYFTEVQTLTGLIKFSGGIDSACTSVITFFMSRLLIDAIRQGNAQVISDVQRIAGAYEKDGWLPESAQALTRNLFQ